MARYVEAHSIHEFKPGLRVRDSDGVNGIVLGINEKKGLVEYIYTEGRVGWRTQTGWQRLGIKEASLKYSNEKLEDDLNYYMGK